MSRSAFQLVDDILDGDGLAGLNGQNAAREEALALTARANEHLRAFGRKGRPLAQLADKMAERLK